MKKLRLVFAIVVVVPFGVLGWIGTHIYQQMPPIPGRVVTADGTVIVASGEIGRGLDG
jgi:nitric oxide reductase subunit B